MNIEIIAAAVWVTVILLIWGIWLWLIYSMIKKSGMWEEKKEDEKGNAD